MRAIVQLVLPRPPVCSRRVVCAARAAAAAKAGGAAMAARAASEIWSQCLTGVPGAARAPCAACAAKVPSAADAAPCSQYRAARKIDYTLVYCADYFVYII